MTSSTGTSTPIVIDSVTILSLLLVVLLLTTAYLVSLRALSSSTPRSLRVLFIWHIFDSLIHFVFEGSYLYNVFFAWMPRDAASLEAVTTSLIPNPLPTVPKLLAAVDPLPNFLSRPDRLYGSASATNPFGALWLVYAEADRRWAAVDLTVVSLELLTVLVGGPLAAYIAWGIAKRKPMVGWWMSVLATAELYGGWMTFCPEWLTGSLNLDTSNFMFLWVYLVFFNGLWVVMPIYAMRVAYVDMAHAFKLRNEVIQAAIKEGKQK